MKLKLSYLICAVDKNKKYHDRDYLRIFLNKDKEVPSKLIETFETDEKTTLKELHSQYLKYDFDFYPKSLCGFRILDKDICEICYLITVRYLGGIEQNGSFYTIEQIQEKNILLEEYYGELFFKFGQSTLR